MKSLSQSVARLFLPKQMYLLKNTSVLARHNNYDVIGDLILYGNNQLQFNWIALANLLSR